MLLFKIKEAPVWAVPLPDLILAGGEATGHRHQITLGKAELTQDGDKRFLEVLSEEATLSHEEHKPIMLERGVYEVTLQREYDPQGWQRTTD